MEERQPGEGSGWIKPCFRAFVAVSPGANRRSADPVRKSRSFWTNHSKSCTIFTDSEEGLGWLCEGVGRGGIVVDT